MQQKSEILLKLESLSNESFLKVADTGMDRKTLNKEIGKAQKMLGIARKDYSEYSSQLASIQEKANAAASALQEATLKLVHLNRASNDMDLSGAHNVAETSDGFAYVIDGKRMHVDTSDVNDVKITPWKDHMKNLRDSNYSEDFTIDLDNIDTLFITTDEESFEDEDKKEASVESQVIVKVAKKFR